MCPRERYWGHANPQAAIREIHQAAYGHKSFNDATVVTLALTLLQNVQRTDNVSAESPTDPVLARDHIACPG